MLCKPTYECKNTDITVQHKHPALPCALFICLHIMHIIIVKLNAKALKLISFDVCDWKAKNKLKGGKIKADSRQLSLKCD